MSVITSADIADYAPHGNAVFTFQLPKVWHTDPRTGNVMSDQKSRETLEYLAHVTLQRPNWKGEAGVDNTAYSCSGRLLTPVEFDPRITNGSQAEAVVNGYAGRFELIWDLTMDQTHRQDLRTVVEGTFRVIGGKA